MRSLLAHPQFFQLFDTLVGGGFCVRFLTANHLRVQSGQRLLDVGCGTAAILADLPADVQYTGCDIHEGYVEAARRRFGDHGRFLVSRVADLRPERLGEFDLVLAKGVLHHLDDAEALALFSLARKVLVAGGRLVTFDGVFVPGQSAAARWILAHDRGSHVRSQAAYTELARCSFSNVQASIYNHLLRIPYTHLVLECQ